MFNKQLFKYCLQDIFPEAITDNYVAETLDFQGISRLISNIVNSNAKVNFHDIFFANIRDLSQTTVNINAITGKTTENSIDISTVLLLFLNILSPAISTVTDIVKSYNNIVYYYSDYYLKRFKAITDEELAKIADKFKRSKEEITQSSLSEEIKELQCYFTQKSNETRKSIYNELKNSDYNAKKRLDVIYNVLLDFVNDGETKIENSKLCMLLNLKSRLPTFVIEELAFNDIATKASLENTKSVFLTPPNYMYAVNDNFHILSGNLPDSIEITDKDINEAFPLVISLLPEKFVKSIEEIIENHGKEAIKSNKFITLLSKQLAVITKYAAVNSHVINRRLLVSKADDGTYDGKKGDPATIKLENTAINFIIIGQYDKYRIGISDKSEKEIIKEMLPTFTDIIITLQRNINETTILREVSKELTLHPIVNKYLMAQQLTVPFIFYAYKSISEGTFEEFNESVDSKLDYAKINKTMLVKLRICYKYYKSQLPSKGSDEYGKINKIANGKIDIPASKFSNKMQKNQYVKMEMLKATSYISALDCYDLGDLYNDIAKYMVKWHCKTAYYDYGDDLEATDRIDDSNVENSFTECMQIIRNLLKKYPTLILNDGSGSIPNYFCRFWYMLPFLCNPIINFETIGDQLNYNIFALNSSYKEPVRYVNNYIKQLQLQLCDIDNFDNYVNCFTTYYAINRDFSINDTVTYYAKPPVKSSDASKIDVTACINAKDVIASRNYIINSDDDKAGIVFKITCDFPDYSDDFFC